VHAVQTTCPFCSCGCGLYLQVDEARLVGVMPSRRHPVSAGRLCARGWAAHEAALWGDRLTRPLLRRDGQLVPVDWDEALAAAAAGLRAAALPGVLGSARLTNEENYLAARLARGALGVGHVDVALRAGYLPLLRELRAVPALRQGSLDDLKRADVVLVLDRDLAASHPRAAFAVLQAVSRGARVIVASATRGQLARVAARHLPMRPGGEAALLAALATAADGRASHTDDAASRAAAWLGEARSPFALVASDALAPEESAAVGRALGRLAAVVWSAAAASVLVLPARANLRGACESGAVPDALPGDLPLANAGAHGRLARAWGREPSAEIGLDAAALAARADALLVLADVVPDAARGARFTVVADAFATTTAAAADVVLPIAAPAESEGTMTSADGHSSPVRPALAPPGLARPGWQVLTELAAALGLPSRLASAGEAAAELAAAVHGAGGGHRLAPVAAAEAAGGGADAAAEGVLLATDGQLDWGSDPLVAMAPTLARERRALDKLYRSGFVEASPEDAKALGVRAGWPVTVRSTHGAATVQLALRDDLPRGLVLVPPGFVSHVKDVLGGRHRVAVRLEMA
jgi:predicted molibdopterin-dependent oxidoreductase YjgC